MSSSVQPHGYDLWGAPFDGGSTLGYPGSRYAPARVREALGWITQRIQDGQIYSLERDAVITLGEDFLRDRGDVPILGHDIVASLEATSAAVTGSLRDGRMPIVVGGDDSLLFPVARGVHDGVSGRVGVVHFDAHLDLLDRNPHQGRWSQSSGMRRSVELERIHIEDCIQVGSRHFNFPSSGQFKHDTGLAHITADEFNTLGPQRAAEQILDRVSGADHLFLSFDIDAIDPAHAPGAGAHEPGGLTSADALEVVRLLAPHCTALAITEVNPMTDHQNMTSVLASYLLFHFAVAGIAR